MPPHNSRPDSYEQADFRWTAESERLGSLDRRRRSSPATLILITLVAGMLLPATVFIHGLLCTYLPN